MKNSNPKGVVPIMKETKENQKSILSIIRRIQNWFAAGDPPPKTQIKSLYLMVFLLIFGFSTGTVWFLAFFRIRFYEVIDHLGVLFILSAITLIPGIYAAVVSFCCWRRVRGYDWWIIPHFE